MADARHAYAVLRGLTSASGAMVAAATTSLPERLEAGRNYDYRYAWIRDQCYAGLAMAAHGPHPMLAGSVRFITERLLADGPGLMPAYTVAGEPIGGERALRLRGFPGGQPRSGNWVRKQFQLDAFGETLSLLAAAAGHDMLAEDDWRAAAVAADAIEKRWQEPDAGIWELDNQHWAHSRMACVSGLRAIAAAAGAGSPGGHGHREAAGWSSLADAITASLADCVHPAGRWQRAPDDERLDAALLLSVIRGGFDLADPRVKATIGAVRDELSADGFVYRFRHDDRPLHKAEGAFLLCGFWMALSSTPAATQSPPRTGSSGTAARGPAALYTEEYDVHQRQLRGNLPQAFVHAGDAGVRRDAVPGHPARRCGRVGRRPSGGSRQNGAGCADPDGEPRLPGGVVQGPDGGAVAGGDRPNLAGAGQRPRALTAQRVSQVRRIAEERMPRPLGPGGVRLCLFLAQGARQLGSSHRGPPGQVTPLGDLVQLSPCLRGVPARPVAPCDRGSLLAEFASRLLGQVRDRPFRGGRLARLADVLSCRLDLLACGH